MWLAHAPVDDSIEAVGNNKKRAAPDKRLFNRLLNGLVRLGISSRRGLVQHENLGKEGTCNFVNATRTSSPWPFLQKDMTRQHSIHGHPTRKT